MTYTELAQQHQELKIAVNKLFTEFLDVVEESDSGKEFHPIYISCCRALKLEPLNNLLKKLKELSKCTHTDIVISLTSGQTDTK